MNLDDHIDALIQSAKLAQHLGDSKDYAAAQRAIGEAMKLRASMSLNDFLRTNTHLPLTIIGRDLKGFNQYEPTEYRPVLFLRTADQASAIDEEKVVVQEQEAYSLEAYGRLTRYCVTNAQALYSEWDSDLDTARSGSAPIDAIIAQWIKVHEPDFEAKSGDRSFTPDAKARIRDSVLDAVFAAQFLEYINSFACESSKLEEQLQAFLEAGDAEWSKEQNLSDEEVKLFTDTLKKRKKNPAKNGAGE